MFPSRASLGVLAVATALLLGRTAAAVEAAADQGTAVQSGTEQPQARIYIREYRVRGAKNLPKIDVEKAVYPYLGPGRTTDDVEQARAALEKAYYDQGYQAIRVEIPEQDGRGGVVFLHVSENPVGRLRVRGSRYFLPSVIKEKAQALAEGKALNFNDINKDILALSKYSDDLTVTPKVKQGVEPGTMDVDLEVKDKAPIHGSLELNNRYSPNTVPLRLNGAISYSNLWQMGHGVGVSFDVAPERTKDSEIISGFYKARFPWWDDFSLLFQATKQDSDVATLGGATTLGRGQSFGLHGVFTLPTAPGFFHSLNVGIDYKDYSDETRISEMLSAAGLPIQTSRVHYYPVSANYSATWVDKRSITELDTTVVAGVRAWGDDGEDYDRFRYRAQGNFIYLRGELSRSQDLPRGFQVFGKVKGQIANEPLISQEQMSGGGLETVRGYLEGDAAGDDAIFLSAELRSPSLLAWWHKKDTEWRLHAFTDLGRLKLIDALPEQEDTFDLASFGFGTRVELFDHLNGSLDVGIPLIETVNTPAHEPRLTFRVWADF